VAVRGAVGLVPRGTIEIFVAPVVMPVTAPGPDDPIDHLAGQTLPLLPPRFDVATKTAAHPLLSTPFVSISLHVWRAAGNQPSRTRSREKAALTCGGDSCGDTSSSTTIYPMI
jgi:hypothetical protein